MLMGSPTPGCVPGRERAGTSSTRPLRPQRCRAAVVAAPRAAERPVNAPAEPPAELTAADDDDDQARRSLAAENARAVSLYSENQLDEALLLLQRLREDSSKLPARIRLTTSPAISSNMAYYFYKRAKYDAALEWLRRASQAEARPYGTADAAPRCQRAESVLLVWRNVQSGAEVPFARRQ